MRQRLRFIGRRAVAALAAVSLVATVLTVGAPPASAAAAWDMTVSRTSASPADTGTTMVFTINAQCSALDEAVCRNSTITWPGDGGVTTYDYASHPAIQSLTYDAGGDEWTLDLNDSVRAGISLQFTIRATVDNGGTPDGTITTFDPTLTADNTATINNSDTGEWNAVAELAIDKYGQFGPGNDLILDTPVRYYLNICDPSWVRDEPGHLWVENVTLVDTLPADVVYNDSSAGGVYDVGTNTVTWTLPGPIETEACDDTGVVDDWVEVTYPSSSFALTTSVQNDATVEGNPLGDAATLLTDSDSEAHSFVTPSSSGTASKYASTPFYGSTDITYAGAAAHYYTYLRAVSSSTAPYYFVMEDQMPCLTNDIDTGPSAQYQSLAQGSTCTDPAFQPDRAVELTLYTSNKMDGFDTAAASALTAVPVRYTTVSGATGSVDLPQSSWSSSYRSWLIGWDDFLAQSGISPTDPIASITFDSRDLDLRVSPGASSTVAVLGLYGTIAESTATYPIVTADRVWNTAYIDLFEDKTAVTPLDTISGTDEVLIEDPEPSLSMYKYDSGSSPNKYFYFGWDLNGSPLQDGEQVVFTDLLPAGYSYAGLRYVGYTLMDPNDPGDLYASSWYSYRSSPTSSFYQYNYTGIDSLDDVSPLNYIDVEILDDYNGTGRELVRVTYDEPPTGWEYGGIDPSGGSLAFFVTPGDLSVPGTNTAQIYPTDPITQVSFVCSGNPSLVSDPNDLDGDGETAADDFCQATRTIPGDTAALYLEAEKSVQGDGDAAMMGFPAIGQIDEDGGTGTFEISLENNGAASADNIVIYDVLPHVGDTAILESLSGAARGSEWEPTFLGVDALTVPSGVQIEYSESTTPCTNELATSGTNPYPTGCTNDWSTSLPAGGAGDVKALRISVVDDTGGLLALDPGEAINIRYDVSYPSGLLPGDVAWNSFAYAGNRVDDGSTFLPTEVPKVGLAVPQVDLSVDKRVYPSTLPVGDPATYTITITHDGAVTEAGAYTLPASTAYNVSLQDDFLAQGLTLVPGTAVIYNTETGLPGGASFDESTGVITIDEFGPNDEYELEYQAYSATAQSVTNTVELMSTAPDVDDIDSTPGNSVGTEDDQDPATATWAVADMTFTKQVETAPGSGVYIEADASDSLVGEYGPYEPINYRFVIENTGGLTISSVDLTDDLTGFECDQYIGSVWAGTTRTIDCTWPYGFALGTHTNTATVTGTSYGTEFTLTDTADVEVTQQFDLALIVEPGASQSDPILDTDTQVSFDVTVQNQGEADPTGAVTISSYIPAGLFLDTAATTAANSGNADFTLQGDGTIDIANLVSTTGNTFTVVLTTDDPATTGTTETFRDTTLTSVVYGAEISSDSAPATLSDRDSTPDTSDTDVIYLGEDSHNDISHFGTAYDQPSEDEDDHDREEIPVFSTFVDIGDYVWSDTDRDGIQDLSESGIEGVLVTLDPNTPGDPGDDLTTLTLADGSYLFEDQEAGTYTVTFTQPGGYSLSPTGAGSDPAVDSNGLTTTVTLAAGEQDLDIDLGLFPSAALGDLVWDDLDGDGIQDLGEPGIDGVTVTLDPNTPGDPSDDLTDVTSGGGLYSFTDLPVGDYTVTFTQPTGTELSPTTAGSDPAADSNGLVTSVTLAGGDNNDTIDLGVYTPVSIGDYVWADLNEDGIQDVSEAGVENVTVTLDPGTPGDPSDDLTDVTDADGLYSFTDLAPGTYTVTFTQPPSTAVSPAGAGSDPALDSNGLTTTVTLESGDNDDTIDLGLIPLAGVGDFVWDDLNANGIQDVGEPGIENVVVTLDPGTPLDPSDDLTDTTDVDGAYSFDDLPSGTYSLAFTQPAGTELSPTTAGSDPAVDSNGLTASVTLAAGEYDETIDLGLYTLASIGDYVWLDANLDGIQDTDEIGVENVTVTLDPGTPLDPSDDLTEATGADGLYSFTDLEPGDYTVTFSQPGGYLLSPADVGLDPAVDSNGLATTVTLESGENNDTIDLGLYQAATIGDLIWDDLNGDGVQDVGEPGIAGVTVTLDPGTPLDPSDDVTDDTDADGLYSFTDLEPGEYTVTFSQPTGTELSPTAAGSDPAVDSNGLTTTVTVASGENNDTIDLGVYTLASLGDFVWDDLDGDGVQDVGEPGIENVTVTLDPGTPGDPSDDVTDLTDADGLYGFTDLEPGDYTVTFSQPSGSTLSPELAGSDPAVDSDGLATTVTLESGENNDTIDLGVYKPITIGDLVWDDLDGDGVQDVGEPGIENVTVTLDPGTPLDPSDDVTDVTDADGLYSFTDLEPGDYTVTFTQPTGTELSPTAAGSDPAVDSNGLTTTVTLASGESDETIDLGVYTLASLGDFVWDDLNGDGVQDVGEPGIENVTVTLDPGTPLDPSDDVTDVTDADGLYGFTDLEPGEYTVTFTQPSGMDLSPTTVGLDPAVDSDGLATTVTLESGENNDTIDLGVYTPVTIGDLVWDDLNGDGVQDVGEPGIENVTVTLDPGTPGDPSDDLTDTTDVDGAYEFTGLAPGDYTVTFSQPAGTTLSPTEAAGDTAVDSNGLTTTVTLASGESDDTIDLGVYTSASVGDYVWADVNEDGIQDGSESGLEGVTVTLDPGTPLDPSDDLTDVTDASGFYQFTDLVPGDYTVTFTQPASTSLSPVGATTADLDSNGLTTTVNLESGEYDDTIDLGIIELVGLGDLVWDDLNGDGIQDVGEPGIENVTVTLDPGTPLDPSDDLTDTTDVDGLYEFADLDPGVYTVTFTPPIGMEVSPTTAGSDPAADSNGLSTTVTLSSGENDPTIDLGLYTPVTIGDYVWDDLNGDGIQNVGEPGIDGVTVTLDPGTPADPSDDLTDITAAGGAYSFTDLAPGTYTVTFTPPVGTVLSPTTAGSDPAADSNGLATTITLDSGQSDDTIDLGVYAPATVGDFVWDDLDGDGIQDIGETGVENVTVTLDPGTPGDPGDDITDVTDADGGYEFAGLAPGDYTVTFTQPAGSTLSPTAATTADADSNELATTVTLASGDVDDTIDLGVYTSAAITGQVWIDAPVAGAVDGEQALGESAVPLVDVTLDPGTPGDPSDDVTVQTDGSGAFTFSDLPPGDYTVTFTQPDGYAVTIEDPSVDSTVNNDGLVTTVTLESGTDIADIDLGLIELSSLAGTVYHDQDLSGDLGVETGIEGATLTLTGTDVTGASVTTTAETLADGTYLFDNVVPGVYTVTETQPTGWYDSETTVGSEGGTAATDEVSAVTLPAGTDATGYDFGEVQPSSIAGTVFVDANINGTDDGEVPIQGVTITLTGTDNLGQSVSDTATTGPDGNYIFSDLPPGDYTVTETQPTLWIDGLATSTGSEGGTFGSSEIADIALGSGVDATGYDFGELTPTSELTLTKTAAPDPSFAGDLMTFTLSWSNDGNIDVTGSTLTETVPAGSTFVSSADAWSCTDGDPSGTTCTLGVADMAPGDTGTATFTVRIDDPLPTGSQVSLPNTAVINGEAQDPNGAFPVGASASAEPVVQSTQIRGVVYHQTPDGDIVLGGGTVSLLDAAGDPVLDPATGEPWTVEVGADGTYLFDGLAPTDYTVVESTPSGYGDADGHAPSVTLSPAIGAPATQDFWHTTSSITGTVYVDEDLDGDLTSGEQPLAGVTVTLTGTDINGDPVEMSTTTNSDGVYIFDGLLAGTYVVTEAQPSLWANGSTDAGDSGGVTTGDDDVVDAIILAAGSDAVGYDFGEVGVPVGGTVFFDGSGNPIAGVDVTLSGTDVFGNPVELTATTGTDGTYQFDNIPPGDYTLTETQPGAYASGSVAATNEIPISVSGTPLLDNDFSEDGAVIAGRVSESVDGTGDPSTVDPGIAGVTVTLTGTDVDGNTVERTTTTDADGNYRFADLPAGTYTVTETQPDEYSNVATIAGSNGGTTSGNDDVITEIVIGPGENATGYDFNEAISAISGVVNIEGTDTPLAGVEVTLYDENGDVVATTVTDENGVYVFPDVLAGTYDVVQTQPDEYGSVSENTLRVEHGTTGTSDVDFVEKAGVIEGVVTVDGVCPPADAGTASLCVGGTISGVTITLTGTDVNGNRIEVTTVTDELGQYRFVDLPAGTYEVVQTQPDGYIDGTVEPDNTIEISLAGGEESLDNEFSEAQTDGIITGVVFEDDTNDPISGVTVQLVDANGVVVATTTTDSNGIYRFSNLPPGTYTIRQVQPDGYEAGTVRPTNDAVVSLGNGETVTQIDFSETTPTAESDGVIDGVIPESLAFTGSSSLSLLAIGAGLVTVGGFGMAAGRRRRRLSGLDD